ncbi:2-amino-4-hydroxy-6-hydroxymethyldihydropteridine diphosphokinase [Microterricola gilva]|uniref:2-amino-4-hydroxy-6-hydroxymethyldihydropteridine diphosphokinase n=1 Tax=Microterricola gilva TaxID=393267 RepID=A0A4Q8AJP1_9MICO|nr:2-amino-4-hydroxy-6-hydroxymethyldihydropteridine diphosphokinase [Microterricola gilva]RZU64009.1 2-amino-4-hydroxy-6-hydroxymethyldihydropteridine diphosphokinase [Microterricola gilva]
MSAQAETAGSPAVIALGANLGDRRATLAAAVRAIADLPGVELTGVSSFIETPALKPHGVDTDAPAYLNGVATVVSALAPHALLDALNAIEHANGRVRAEHWGDRTLDLDLITYAELQQSDDRLTLPHPRAAERDFVLRPWLELQPDAVVPGRGRVDALLAALTVDQPVEAEETGESR